jgi:light-harvesting protein B-800-850 alpha chain
MNQGRIWTVVNPTVGLPLFLGSVTLISFTVHFAVIENTNWAKRYWQGADAAAEAKPAATAMNGYSINVSPSGPDGAIKVDVTPAAPEQQAMNVPAASPAKAPPPTGG